MRSFRRAAQHWLGPVFAALVILLSGACVSTPAPRTPSQAVANATRTTVPTTVPLATPTPTATLELVPPTPLPILTTPASPTSAPKQTATADESAPSIGAAESSLVFADGAVSVAGDCEQSAGSHLPGVLANERFICSDPHQIKSPAAGRVVASMSPASLVEEPTRIPGWEWVSVASSRFLLAIDHGPQGQHTNVTSVFLSDTAFEPYPIGAIVEADVPIGTSTRFDWQLWTPSPSDTSRQPDRDDDIALAAVLATRLASPVSEACPLDLANQFELPNAPREYRNGVHAGVDFICANEESSAYAAFDGTVILVVDNFEDPSTSDRNSVLGNAALATQTPRWSLNMLYGNYVMVAHRFDDIDVPIVTIYAHLSAVQTDLIVGATVRAGDRLGTVGNQGTSVAAARVTSPTDRSIHLHWELHVGTRYLGEGLSFTDTVATYETLLCDAQTIVQGC